MMISLAYELASNSNVYEISWIQMRNIVVFRHQIKQQCVGKKVRLYELSPEHKRSPIERYHHIIMTINISLVVISFRSQMAQQH